MSEKFKRDPGDSTLVARLLGGLASGLAVLAVADNVFDWNLAKSSSQWILPLILATLSVLVWKLERIEQHVTSGTTSEKRVNFDNRSELYLAKRDAANRAHRTLHVTYNRADPPEPGSPAAEYFQQTLRWVQADPTRSLKRIIRVPAGNTRMAEWARTQLELAEATDGYHVRILSCSAGEPEPMSFAVIDDDKVFQDFCIGGDNELRAISYESEEVARTWNYYFESLWSCGSTDLEIDVTTSPVR